MEMRATGGLGGNAELTDPVCGMTLNQRDPQRSSRHGTTIHYFCSSECKSKFDANPAQWDRRPETLRR